MNSTHSVFRYSNYYRTGIVLVAILMGIEKSLAQDSLSLAYPNQDTSKSVTGTHRFLRAQSPVASLLFPARNFLQQNTDGLAIARITQLLAAHPELRNAALQEQLRLKLSNTIDNNFTQSLNIYLLGNPILENKLTMNMRRYGVPYDPLRPTAYQIGYTFYLNDVISWMENGWK
jgi:hypothetical protein